MGKTHVKLYINFDQWFMSRCCLRKKFTHDRQTPNGERPITKAHLEPLAQLS